MILATLIGIALVSVPVFTTPLARAPATKDTGKCAELPTVQM